MLSSRVCSAFLRCGSRKVMLRGPGSKNTAPPVALWECTPSMMTAGGSSSKQQPATNSAALSRSTCAALGGALTPWG